MGTELHLRNPFMGGPKEPVIDETSFKHLPEHPEKSAVRNPAFNRLHEEPMMHRVEVTREVAFDDPASRGALDGVRDRQFDGADSVMHAASRAKPVGHPSEVTFPDGIHGHQHGALNHSVAQARNPERALLPVGFGNVDATRRLGTICAGEQFRAQPLEFFSVLRFPAALGHPIDSRRASAGGGEGHAGRFFEPVAIRDESQEAVKPTVWLLHGPRCQFALHFADYQRSSPHWVR